MLRPSLGLFNWSMSLHNSWSRVLQYADGLRPGRVRPLLIVPFAPFYAGSDPENEVRDSDSDKDTAFIQSKGTNYLVIWHDSVLQKVGRRGSALQVAPVGALKVDGVSTHQEVSGAKAFTEVGGICLAAGTASRVVESSAPSGQEPASPSGTGPYQKPSAMDEAPPVEDQPPGDTTAQDFAGIFSPTHRVRAKLQRETDGAGLLKLGALDNDVSFLMQTNGIRHCQLAVVQRGQLIYMKAFTRAESNYEPVSIRSPFRWASVSKPITATAIMKLWELGWLPLRSSIAEALGSNFAPLPGLQLHPDWERVTLNHLLRMRSGLRFGQADPEVIRAVYAAFGAAAPENPISRKQYLQYIASAYPKEAGVSPLRENGLGNQQYQNVNYFLLGWVVTNAANAATYEDAIRELIFDPLNIPQAGGPSTAHGSFDEQDHGEAFYNSDAPRAIRGWWDPAQQLTVNPYGTNFDLEVGAGSWRMSALHIARFLAGFFLDNVISRDTRGQMWERPPAGDEWGRGWRVDWRRALGQGRRSAPWVLASAFFRGSYSGTSSTIQYWPADDMAITMVSNASPKNGVKSVFSGDWLRARLADLLGPAGAPSSYDLFETYL